MKLKTLRYVKQTVTNCPKLYKSNDVKWAELASRSISTFLHKDISPDKILACLLLS